jgi:hypothetical protein
MNWNSPRYVEIKMDAEIGSYQEDPDFPEFVEPVSLQAAKVLDEGSPVGCR